MAVPALLQACVTSSREGYFIRRGCLASLSKEKGLAVELSSSKSLCTQGFFLLLLYNLLSCDSCCNLNLLEILAGWICVKLSQLKIGGMLVISIKNIFKLSGLYLEVCNLYIRVNL